MSTEQGVSRRAQMTAFVVRPGHQPGMWRVEDQYGHLVGVYATELGAARAATIRNSPPPPRQRAGWQAKTLNWRGVGDG